MLVALRATVVQVTGIVVWTVTRCADTPSDNALGELG
jgi:hypothetical protein